MTVTVAQVWRGERVESTHEGNVAVVRGDGRVLAHAGDPRAFVYARSAMKPVQALALVESGAADRFSFSQADLALCAASHSGETAHVERVRNILKRLSLDESALQCGVHPPRYEPAAIALYRERLEPSPAHNNCSGKHTGMLAAALMYCVEPGSYLDPANAVQRHILRAVCALGDIREEDVAVAVDGCGAPVFGLPLSALALIFARLGTPDDAPQEHREALRRIRDAMLAHPDLVAGTGRFCTALLSHGAGRFVGKAGAEGVYGVGVVDRGEGIAVKIADGNARAVHPVVLSALRQRGHAFAEFDAGMEGFRRPAIINVMGREVGDIRPSFNLEVVEEAAL